MTSCKKKKKGEGLTKDEAQIELIAAQEALVALDVEVSEMPAVKIIDHLLKTQKKMTINEFDHLLPSFYHNVFFFWKDNASDVHIGSIDGMESNGLLTEAYNYAPYHYGITFPWEGVEENMVILWENILDSANIVAANLGIKTPFDFSASQGTPVLATVYCAVADNDRSNGQINFTLTGNDKHLIFASNNGTTEGIGRGAVVVGSGSFVHTFFIQNAVKENLYRVVKGHGQAALGLVGYDKDEFVVGSLKMEMTTKTVLTSSTDIVLYRMGDTKDKICSMAADGTITYKDGSTTSLSNVAPKLWEHLKAVFSEKLK